mmetsp:Transcript_145435/g.466054  ORF Transcript_145435/g.466054 Transcript_145435/m.466054 type:complete len:457 (-) Transcript_145435:132-1502(-)
MDLLEAIMAMLRHDDGSPAVLYSPLSLSPPPQETPPFAAESPLVVGPTARQLLASPVSRFMRGSRKAVAPGSGGTPSTVTPMRSGPRTITPAASSLLSTSGGRMGVTAGGFSCSTPESPSCASQQTPAPAWNLCVFSSSVGSSLAEQESPDIWGSDFEWHTPDGARRHRDKPVAGCPRAVSPPPMPGDGGGAANGQQPAFFVLASPSTGSPRPVGGRGLRVPSPVLGKVGHSASARWFSVASPPTRAATSAGRPSSSKAAAWSPASEPGCRSAHILRGRFRGGAGTRRASPARASSLSTTRSRGRGLEAAFDCDWTRPTIAAVAASSRVGRSPRRASSVPSPMPFTIGSAGDSNDGFCDLVVDLPPGVVAGCAARSGMARMRSRHSPRSEDSSGSTVVDEFRPQRLDFLSACEDDEEVEQDEEAAEPTEASIAAVGASAAEGGSLEDRRVGCRNSC